MRYFISKINILKLWPQFCVPRCLNKKIKIRLKYRLNNIDLLQIYNTCLNSKGVKYTLAPAVKNGFLFSLLCNNAVHE